MIILKSELKIESARANQFREGQAVEKKNLENYKKLSEELEISLRNNMREDNEVFQSINMYRTGKRRSIN